MSTCQIISLSPPLACFWLLPSFFSFTWDNLFFYTILKKDFIGRLKRSWRHLLQWLQEGEGDNIKRFYNLPSHFVKVECYLCVLYIFLFFNCKAEWSFERHNILSLSCIIGICTPLFIFLGHWIFIWFSFCLPNTTALSNASFCFLINFLVFFLFNSVHYWSFFLIKSVHYWSSVHLIAMFWINSYFQKEKSMQFYYPPLMNLKKAISDYIRNLYFIWVK